MRIYILITVVLLFSCDNTFDFLQAESVYISSIEIASVPLRNPDGLPWDDKSSVDFGVMILDYNRTDTLATSEIVTCDPLLLSISLPLSCSITKTHQRYKIVVFDQDPAENEIIGSIEVVPADFYNGGKRNFTISNKSLKVTLFVEWQGLKE